MKCNGVPNDKAEEAIKRTKETGLGHGFIQCEDGSTSNIVSGDDDDIDLEETCEEVKAVFYTRPDNVPALSSTGRDMLHRGEVNTVCVGVEVGSKAYTVCERSQTSCRRTLERPIDEFPFE